MKNTHTQYTGTLEEGGGATHTRMGKACVTSHQKASSCSFQVQLPAANERSSTCSRHCVDSLSWGLIQLPKKIGASCLVRGVVLRIGGVKWW